MIFVGRDVSYSLNNSSPVFIEHRRTLYNINLQQNRAASHELFIIRIVTVRH